MRRDCAARAPGIRVFEMQKRCSIETLFRDLYEREAAARADPGNDRRTALWYSNAVKFRAGVPGRWATRKLLPRYGSAGVYLTHFDWNSS